MTVIEDAVIQYKLSSGVVELMLWRFQILELAREGKPTTATTSSQHIRSASSGGDPTGRKGMTAAVKRAAAAAAVRQPKLVAFSQPIAELEKESGYTGMKRRR